MPGKKNGRFCSKCEIRHSAPTGKKCKRTLDNDKNRFAGLEDEFNQTDRSHDGDSKAGHSDTDDFGAGALELGYGHTAELRKLEFKMEDRLARLENLVYTTLDEVKGRKAQPELPLDKAPDGESDSSIDELFTKPRKTQTKAQRREPKYGQDQFIRDGEAMTSFNTVVLAGVRMIRQLAQEGESILPALKHLEFVAKKSTMGSYRQEAFVSYDRVVIVQQ